MKLYDIDYFANCLIYSFIIHKLPATCFLNKNKSLLFSGTDGNILMP